MLDIITFEIHENYENHKIPRGHHENHKNLKIKRESYENHET